QLRLPPTLFIFVHHRQRFSQHGQPLFGLPYFPIRLSQQRQTIRPLDLCPYGFVGGQTLAYLCNSLFSLPLLGQCPAPWHGPHRQLRRKPLLGRKGNGCLGVRLGCFRLPTKLTELSSQEQGKTQTIGMRKFLRQSQHLVVPLQSLVWVAKQPQSRGRNP